MPKKKVRKPVTNLVHPVFPFRHGNQTYFAFYTSSTRFAEGSCRDCVNGKCTKKILFGGDLADEDFIAIHGAKEELN